MPREGREQHASSVRRGRQPDEGGPGSGPGGGDQEAQSDPGKRSQQRREGQEPPPKCEYTPARRAGSHQSMVETNPQIERR